MVNLWLIIGITINLIGGLEHFLFCPIGTASRSNLTFIFFRGGSETTNELDILEV
jgi:hypothetical protein